MSYGYFCLDSNSVVSRKISRVISERAAKERRDLAALQARLHAERSAKRLVAEEQRRRKLDRLLERLFPSLPPAALIRPGIEIIADVARVYGLTVGELTGARRQRSLILPRHEAFYRVAHERQDLSLTQIGGLFHRDHTTILNGIRQHAKRNGLPLLRGMTRVAP